MSIILHVVDINECLKGDVCEQSCVNTNGSYYCTCYSGYELNSDGKTCSRK